MHKQLRSLTILDGLISNAGPRFQRTFADEPLLERLRVMARDDTVDPDVKAKCNLLFRQWAVAYKNTTGLEKIASLYKQLPQTKRLQPHQSKVVRETEADVQREELASPTTPTHSRNSSAANASLNVAPSGSRVVAIGSPAAYQSTSIFKKDKKSKNKPFNLEKEKPQMVDTIAQASIASTNLMNGLQLINREVERVSDNPEVVSRFETCKVLRRQVLRYIQHVESEPWIGSLLTANDELVKALMAYEIKDKSISDDSDSDAERYAAGVAASSEHHRAEQDLAGLKLEDAAPPKPPRPTQVPMPAPTPTAAGKQRVEDSEPEEEEDDEDNPFADKNAVKTPYIEKEEMTW
jgi:LAS seventeen-binding protein 5